MGVGGGGAIGGGEIKKGASYSAPPSPLPYPPPPPPPPLPLIQKTLGVRHLDILTVRCKFDSLIPKLGTQLAYHFCEGYIFAERVSK